MQKNATNPPTDTPENITPPPHKSRTFPVFYVFIIFGIAVLLATLFTLWTPGKPLPQLSWLSINIPIAQNTPTLSQKITVEPPSQIRIGIVAGHWMNDPGAVCPDGVKEVDVNLKIASLVQKNLKDQGYEVDLLKEFDPLLTGYQSSALISIHADSCEFINSDATGYKVVSAMGSKRPEQSARLTACIRNRYGKSTGLKLHSTSVTEDMTSYHAFGEIEENTPAAIIETGFLNLDKQFLTQKPEVAAQGIIDGILCFLKNESVFPQPSTTTPSPAIPTPITTPSQHP